MKIMLLNDFGIIVYFRYCKEVCSYCGQSNLYPPILETVTWVFWNLRNNSYLLRKNKALYNVISYALAFLLRAIGNVRPFWHIYDTHIANCFIPQYTHSSRKINECLLFKRVDLEQLMNAPGSHADSRISTIVSGQTFFGKCLQLEIECPFNLSGLVCRFSTWLWVWHVATCSYSITCILN